MVNIALGEVGYLEKASDDQLDDKTANAGTNNYTKYGKWYGMQSEWCAMFVSWCANQAGILTTASTASAPYVFKHSYVPTMYDWYQSNGRLLDASSNSAQAGDIAFFSVEGNTRAHVGIVVSASGNTITTVEGNTSNAVQQKTYTGRVNGGNVLTHLGR